MILLLITAKLADTLSDDLTGVLSMPDRDRLPLHPVELLLDGVSWTPDRFDGNWYAFLRLVSWFDSCGSAAMADADVMVIPCFAALGLAFGISSSFENFEGPLVGVCSNVGIRDLRAFTEVLFAAGSGGSLLVEEGTRTQLDGGISSTSSEITADFLS